MSFVTACCENVVVVSGWRKERYREGSVGIVAMKGWREIMGE